MAIADNGFRSVQFLHHVAKQALEVATETGGPDHPNVAASLGNQARVYDTQGRYTEAETLFKRALAINEKTLGANHPKLAKGLDDMAEFFESQKRTAETTALYRRSLGGIREAVLSLDRLAGALFAGGLSADFGEIEALYQRALDIEEKALGPDSPNGANRLSNFGLSYESLGKYARAKSFYKRALEIRERALGPNHLEVAKSLENLAGLYFAQGQTGKAQPLYDRALEIRDKAHGR